jgi:small subunit ribosomal protein S18
MEKKQKTANIEHFDYKDVAKLRAHMNAHSRMMGRGRTGLTSHEQRNFAQAVKRARFLALIPYVSE